MIAIEEWDYNGTYEGTVLYFDEERDSITIDCPMAGEPDSNWRISRKAVWDSNPINVGDPVRLYVEFNNYRVVGVERIDLNPEDLRDRINRLEQIVALLALNQGIDLTTVKPSG